MPKRTDTDKRSPRERLLDAAGELFYAEGVQSVGIDRVIERAGVAKASLYSSFGSKEELVRAYLEQRHGRQLERLRTAVAAVPEDDPAGRLLAVFDAQSARFTASDYHGCAFIAAAAEAPRGGRIDDAAHVYRAEVLTLLTELADAAGVEDPQLLGHQLQALYDGASTAANLDRNAAIAGPIRAAAQTLIAAARGANSHPRRVEAAVGRHQSE